MYHKEGGDEFVKILATIEDWQLTPLSKLSQTLKKEGSLTQPEFENLVTIIDSDPNATEAYFYRNDFYPFVRAELQKHDPAGYAVMERVWGKL